MKRFILGSLLAGMLIGTGADMQSTLLSIGANPYLAAFVFSLGLCCVRYCRVPLYTGKVGTAFESEHIFVELCRLLVMFVVNVVGASLVTFLPWSCDWWQANLPLQTGWGVLLPAMLCGGLVHLATRPERSYAATSACVIAFIVGGGQHCIANAYHVAKIGFTEETVFFLLLCALGNALGAWLVWVLETAEE